QLFGVVERSYARFARPYPHDVLDVGDEYLACAYLAVIEYLFGNRNDELGIYSRYYYVDLNLGKKVHSRLYAAVLTGLACLNAASHYVGYRHAGDADLSHCILEHEELLL